MNKTDNYTCVWQNIVWQNAVKELDELFRYSEARTAASLTTDDAKKDANNIEGRIGDIVMLYEHIFGVDTHTFGPATRNNMNDPAKAGRMGR